MHPLPLFDSSRSPQPHLNAAKQRMLSSTRQLRAKKPQRNSIFKQNANKCPQVTFNSAPCPGLQAFLSISRPAKLPNLSIAAPAYPSALTGDAGQTPSPRGQGPNMTLESEPLSATLDSLTELAGLSARGNWEGEGTEP